MRSRAGCFFSRAPPTLHPAAHTAGANSALFSSTTSGGLDTPLWIDTDVGFDDLVAIGCCLGSGRLAGISTVGGGLTHNPSDGAAILRGIPLPPVPIIVTGKSGPTGAPTEGEGPADPSWLVNCREQMRGFCASEGIQLPSGEDDRNDGVKSHEATAALFSHDIERMDLVCLGPLTNLAHWLEEIPGFGPGRLNSVWILGGNLPVGEENGSVAASSAEFNFARDPAAVRTVLGHHGLKGIPVHVVPQEVCDRGAFEGSFCRPNQPSDRPPSAMGIIEGWLRSPAPKLPRGEEDLGKSLGTAAAGSGCPAVASMLPAWMVRLIRTRNFSVYGDPICLYIRDHDYIPDGESQRRHPRIVWKEYSFASSCGSNDDVLAVDPEGRLVLRPEDGGTATGQSSRGHQNGDQGITVHIAHEVELGPVYTDWLTGSLLSSFSTTRK